MGMKDNGDFRIRRTPEKDGSDHSRHFELGIHVSNGRCATLDVTKTDLEYMRSQIGRTLKQLKEETR